MAFWQQTFHVKSVSGGKRGKGGGMDSFDKALAHTLGIEGGYVDDPTDRGGKTRYGITEAVARKWGYDGPMHDLPLDLAKRIYRGDYWDVNRLDVVAAWDEAVALEMFDTGVNQGAQDAGIYLQRALNLLNRSNREEPLFPDLMVDGLIGSRTIGALHFLTTDQEHRVLLTMLNVQQGYQYIEIMERRKSHEKYARGWFDRVQITTGTE